MIEEDVEINVKRIDGWQCTFCGEVYPTKGEAEKCWENHIKFQFEPIFFIGEEFPTEVLVKKVEGNYYTEIGTYPLQKKEKVRIRVGGKEHGKEN